MKINRLFLAIFLFVSVQLTAQAEKNGDSSFELFPDGRHFNPLYCNQQEAHFGILYFTENSNLKVDIGNSVDVIGYNFSGNKMRLTVGIDFFAFAYSTSFKGNRLQIDALDGFFGGNAVFSKRYEGGKLSARFRIIHNSAHLVDGHFDQSVDKWIDDKKPIPFTKDFGELIFMNENIDNRYLLKYYGGVSYSTLVRPSDMKKYGFIAGSEFMLNNFFGKILNKETSLCLAYNFNLVEIPEYCGNNNALAGVKFGSPDGKGLLLYFNYYSGKNYFSEYYKDGISRTGIGFMVDF
jgi:hypothetical protein